MKKTPNPNKMKWIKGPKVTKEDLENVKIRITTFIDKDLVEILKDMAKKRGGKYQTLLNSILRSTLTGEDSIEDLTIRIERLEKAILKQRKAG